MVILESDYRALLRELSIRDSSQMWLDAINNVNIEKKNKSKEVFGVGSAYQIIYQPKLTNISSSQPAQPVYMAVIEQKFKKFEARQTKFNNRLQEVVRLVKIPV